MITDNIIEYILSIKINGQVIYSKDEKDNCIPTREETSDFSTGNINVTIDTEVIICKEA